MGIALNQDDHDPFLIVSEIEVFPKLYCRKRTGLGDGYNISLKARRNL